MTLEFKWFRDVPVDDGEILATVQPMLETFRPVAMPLEEAAPE